MTIFQAVLLGVLQGITEFFPVSSSGHLVLLEHWFGLSVDATSLLGFDVLLHAATLCALLLAYAPRWKRLLLSPFSGNSEDRRLLLLLILATVPGAAGGFFLQDVITDFFRTPHSIAIAFLVTSVVLIAGERIGRRGSLDMDRAGVGHALIIGFAQMCALVPGLSRSGLTISAGRALQLTREAALDFSFLMAVPIIAGAAGKTALDALEGDISLPSPSVSLAGFCASLVVSYIAIFTLRRWASRRSLAWFAWYLVPLGLLLLLF